MGRGDPRHDDANPVQDGDPCAHAGCGCRAEPGSAPYCGAYCANADRDEPPEGACACEHRACADRQRVRAADPEPATGLGPDPAS